MIGLVRQSTMDAAVEAERAAAAKELLAFYSRYGKVLERVTALQTEMSAWMMNAAGNITPEQAAQMFYAKDDGWQAAFFNVMQAQVTAHHDSLPEARPGEIKPYAGVPAGEAQWYYMAGKLDDSGFETLEAMFDHARQQRDNT